MNFLQTDPAKDFTLAGFKTTANSFGQSVHIKRLAPNVIVSVCEWADGTCILTIFHGPFANDDPASVYCPDDHEDWKEHQIDCAASALWLVSDLERIIAGATGAD